MLICDLVYRALSEAKLLGEGYMPPIIIICPRRIREEKKLRGRE